MSNVNWLRAACRGEDTEIWFQERSRTVDGMADTRYARDVCISCVIRSQCLDEAMRLEGRTGPDSRFGIRGGLTGYERANLRRRLLATTPKAEAEAA